VCKNKMIPVCLVGLGKNGIKVSRYVSSLISVKKLFINDEPGEGISALPNDKVSFLESEKVSTDYDEYFINMLNNYKGIDLKIVISDFYDYYSLSLTKVFGKFSKKLHFNTLGIFFIPSKSEGNKYEIAQKELELMQDNFDLIIQICKDDLLKAFRDIPIKLIDKAQTEVVYLLIKIIFETLSVQDFLNISSKSKYLGFGLGITDRMDKILEAYMEAESSPWLSSGEKKFLIIFNGNLVEDDLNDVNKIIKFKDFDLRINKNIKQERRIEVFILSY